MDWLKETQEGSFRGVNFKTESTSSSGKPGWATHTMLNNTIEHEPIPDGVRTESITGFMITNPLFAGSSFEDSAVSQWGRLERALLDKTEGVLIHPKFGSMKVIPKPFSVATSQSGRLVTFNLSFEVVTRTVTDIPTRIAPADPTTSVENARVSGLKKTGDWLDDVYDILSAPLAAIEEARDAILSVCDTLARVKKVTNLVNEYQREIGNVVGAIQANLFYIQSIRNDLELLMSWGSSAVDNNDFIPSYLRPSVLDSYLQLADSSFGTAIEGTPASYIGQYVRNASLLLAGASLASAKYNSQEEMIKARDEVMTRMQTLIDDDTTDFRVTEAMQEMIRVVGYALDNGALSENLARTINIQKGESVGRVCKSVYGSIQKLDEILANNRIQDPIFMDEKVSLEVLNA